MFFLAVYSLPSSRSNGNKKVQKFLKTFCFGKRLLYLLFGKNIDALFWDDMLLSLYEDHDIIQVISKKAHRSFIKSL